MPWFEWNCSECTCIALWHHAQSLSCVIKYCLGHSILMRGLENSFCFILASHVIVLELIMQMSADLHMAQPNVPDGLIDSCMLGLHGEAARVTTCRPLQVKMLQRKRKNTFM